MSRDAETGSIVPVVAGVVTVALVLAAGIGAIGQGLVARSRASTAADAAALAAAAVSFRPFGSDGDPIAEASRFADEHGATLVSCDCPVDRTYAPRRATVVVAIAVDVLGVGVRRFEATSSAVLEPVALLTQTGP